MAVQAVELLPPIVVPFLDEAATQVLINLDEAVAAHEQQITDYRQYVAEWQAQHPGETYEPWSTLWQ